MGDKRRRGKRGARTVEDSAHRSSRSRHLSPMIPVAGAGGLVKHGGFESAGLAVCSLFSCNKGTRIAATTPRCSVVSFRPVFRANV